ncbi:putative ankyrin repeat protein RF_0381 [Haliotis rubra]|uniref:putative ankyrin repeat protein RF_0381 n=1 Tax=Haliotis rubra TaxID=36100 RepID=UPI001EE52CD7|nr:putative ankyrin repeat protein RF_0381 [Haliotis rubra]
MAPESTDPRRRDPRKNLWEQDYRGPIKKQGHRCPRNRCMQMSQNRDGPEPVQAESCSQKTCQGVRCLKTFTGNVVCVPEKENKQPSMTQPNTNFMRACMDGVQCGVKLLLSGGQADINTRDILRRTPVMFAAMRAYKDMFHLLVREGADLSSVDQDQNTILHTACEGGNLNIVKYILNENIVDVDSRNFDNMTPIMKSALNGHADVFDGLVEKGADLLLVDHYHSTILHFASLGGSVDIVDRILRVDRVNINSTDNQHRTPVMIAASKGHKDVFDLLVSKGADLTLNDDNDTILYAACQGGNIEIVKYVLGQDVSYINTRGSEGFTPVLLAAFNGYWEVFHFLLLKEASLSVRPDSGENILHVACIGGNLKIVKYVLKQNTEDINSRGTEGMTPAMRAACCGHKDVFDLLVKKGADLSLVDSNENNILHMACAGGNKELIKYVIAKDIVDINSRSKQGTTPVIGAALIGYKELLHLLSINGADMATTDETGSSILHLALLQHEGETARYIITQDFVNINDTNYQGMTPVLLAVVNGYADVFALLVRKGASLSSVDASGDNILQNACDGGNADIVKYLLTVKDIVHDINRKGKAGLTPVMVAARSGNKGVFDLLVKNGAELTQVDDDGNTILHLACTANVQIVKYLLSHNTVDINTRGAYGRTPLLTTARSGNRLAFDELLKKGADTSMKDNEDNNILHLATEQGDHPGNTTSADLQLPPEANSKEPKTAISASGTRHVLH